MDNIVFSIGVMIIVATILALLSRWLKQPQIPAYILAGVIIGPVLHLVNDASLISTLSTIGIAFLLFIVGLEINFKQLKDVYLASTLGGAVQVAAVFGITFLVALAFSFKSVEAAYIGFAIAFSSTMVVIKLLSDKHELQTLHGRIIVGIMVMQDILAISAMIILHAAGNLNFIQLLTYVVQGGAIIFTAIAASVLIFPPIFRFCAKSQELLFLAATAVCFIFAIAAEKAGFSIAIGAFIAGITLANIPYNFEISGRIKPVKDFFAILFFVTLGTYLVFSVSLNILFIMALLAITLLLKPLITAGLCYLLGYSRRTSLITGFSVAQISEFSLILAAEGLHQGIISQTTLSEIIIVAIISITLTPYLMNSNNKMYSNPTAHSTLFGKPAKLEHDLAPKSSDHEVIVCGYDRIGFSIVKTLKNMKKKILVVDYDPDIIKSLSKEGIPALYGDITDPATIERMAPAQARILVSTVPDFEANRNIIAEAKKHKRHCFVIVTADKIDEALDLYKEGADYVILPHFLGAAHASVILNRCANNVDKMVEAKISHINELHERIALGHDHPQHYRNSYKKQKNTKQHD